MNVYHMLMGNVPGILGDILYPMNELEKYHPILVEEKRKKYVGREYVFDQEIPHLNCKWNDVIFLTPAHPNLICAALASCMEQEMRSFPYYEIPVSRLPHRQMAYWHFKMRDYDTGDVEPFDPQKYREITALPEATIEYYLEKKRAGERPLWFVHVPHVFLKGAIDVRNDRLQYTEVQKPS